MSAVKDQLHRACSELYNWDSVIIINTVPPIRAYDYKKERNISVWHFRLLRHYLFDKLTFHQRFVHDHDPKRNNNIPTNQLNQLRNANTKNNNFLHCSNHRASEKPFKQSS